MQMKRAIDEDPLVKLIFLCSPGNPSGTLISLSDVQQLYNACLSNYKLELALQVAKLSDMDPKEYLPYLNKLKLLSENEMRYQIDDYLKNYTSALENMVLASIYLFYFLEMEFETCLNYCIKYKIFNTGFHVFKNLPQYSHFLTVYGDYLLLNKQYNDAGEGNFFIL